MPRSEELPRLAVVEYMRREYTCNMRVGGTDHNSRVVAAILGAQRYGVARERARVLLDKVLGGASCTS